MAEHRPIARFLDRTTPPHVVTLVLIAGLGAMGMNIFLPSLPAMTAHFQTEYGIMQLSVSLYLASNAMVQIFIGPISDKIGRRPVMLACIVGFCLATLGTLMASTIEAFLIYRMGQAIIVAGMVLSRAAVRDILPGPEAASMIGYVTMGMALVPMIAPTIGGGLDQLFGWQASFWFMLACGIATFVLVWLDQGETAHTTERRLMDQIREYPELLMSPRFWGYVAAAAFASGAFFAYLGGAPFVATEVFGLSPAVMGLFFGAPAAGYAFGNFLSGRYARHVGINKMILWGTLIACSALTLELLIYATVLAPHYVFFGLFVFVGLGNGLVIPNSMAGMLSVRPKLAGSASGLGGAAMIGGGAALSAFAGTVMTEGSGPVPLIILMFLTSLISVAAILFVIRRARVLEASLP